MDMKYLVREAFEEASLELLLQEPFYAHLLGTMRKVYCDAVKTAGVRMIPGGQVELGINPSFFLNECQPRQRVAVLKHELLHVILGHLGFSSPTGYPHVLANIAADLVVNQYIGRWPLPDGSVSLGDFSESLQLAPYQSIEHYHDRLLELYNEMKTREVLENGQWKPKAGSKFKLRDYAILEAILSAYEEKTIEEWASEFAKDLSDSEKKKFLSEITNTIRKIMSNCAGFSQGLPRPLAHHLANLEAPKGRQINWKAALRNFRSQVSQSGIRFTNKRPSKRYGTIPGSKIRKKSHLVVAIDTSGSINDATLQMFSTEIQKIYRAGATITVVECDCKVHRAYPYGGKKLEGFVGHGGTDFDPVFEWMNQGRRFDGCIYLTDGYGGTPKITPKCKVLWVISPNGTTKHVSGKFGQAVLMK